MSLDDLFGPGASAPDPSEGAGADRPARAPKPARQPRQPRQPRAPRPPKPARQPRGPRPPRDDRSRTPLILAIIAGILLVAVAVTLGFALTRPTGTGAEPTTPPSTTSAAPPSPTATPSPSPSTVGIPVSLDFSATGFTLADDTGGVVFTYAWTDSAKTAVTALSKAFGAEPTQRIEPGDGSHYPDYTVYQWDGFMLFDMIETPGGTPRAQYPQPSYALFSRNDVGGIAIGAERGLSIGMTVDAVRALGPDEETPRGTVGAIRFTFDRERTNAPGAPQYSEFADTDGTTVTAILYFRYSAL